MPLLRAPSPRLLDGAALFLDFDGTLVDLAETPDAIQVPAALGPLLARLAKRLQGRVAIVSGRALADLRRHLPSAGLAMSGSHGLELMLANGTVLPMAAPDGVNAAKTEVRAFAPTRRGLLVEEKPAGVALHYRQAPEAAGAVKRFMDDLGRATGLAVQHGKMVAELRAPGADKGDAVRTFMATPAFGGGRPIFVGDDLTDEHAFASAAALGGAGVLVGPERDTAAAYRVPDVGAVAAWLGDERCAT